MELMISFHCIFINDVSHSNVNFRDTVSDLEYFFLRIIGTDADVYEFMENFDYLI